MNLLKIFDWEGRKAPSTSERAHIDGFGYKETRPVPVPDASHIRAQLAEAAKRLAPFDASPACPRCASTSIITEYGNKYWVPDPPEMPARSLMYGPWGRYEEGTPFLIRSCGNCKYAWATATAQNPSTDVVADQSEKMDATRYRWLRGIFQGAVGGGVEVNDARLTYGSTEPGTEVRVFWYPDTPVGFHESLGATLDEAIDNVLCLPNPIGDQRT